LAAVRARSYVIVEDTDLIGDVTCDVPNGTAGFSFGAPGVELRLNFVWTRAISR
jgi:hypothetical protein